MTDLIILAFVNAFIIIGWNRATMFEYERGVVNFVGDEPKVDEESKMALWKLRYWAIQNFGEFWSKPLFTCPTCMASVHSTYVYWAYQPLTTDSILLYPLYILFLAGVTTFINNHS